MTVYSVSYDLNKQGQDYKGLIDSLQSFDGYCKVMKSYWFVCSNGSADEVYNILRQYIDENDRILVMEVSKNHRGWLDKSVCEWISKHI